MTKAEILSIRALPKKYVCDGLQFCSFNGYVVAVHTTLPPIKWEPKTGWTRLKLNPSEP